MPSASSNYIYMQYICIQYTYLRVHMTRFAMNLYRARTSPPGGHRARYLDSLASSAVGVLAARACGLVSVSSSRWYTRSVPVQLPYDTRASRVFPQKLIIISPRIQVAVVEVYPAIILSCRHVIAGSLSHWCYDESKNFAPKCVSSHPQHRFGSSFLVCSIASLFSYIFSATVFNFFFLHFFHSKLSSHSQHNSIITRYNNIIALDVI